MNHLFLPGSWYSKSEGRVLYPSAAIRSRIFSIGVTAGFSSVILWTDPHAQRMCAFTVNKISRYFQTYVQFLRIDLCASQLCSDDMIDTALNLRLMCRGTYTLLCTRARLHQELASTLQQLCDDTNDSILNENNGVAPEWGCNPFSSDFIVFNENCFAGVIAEFSQCLRWRLA